jgi:hypothetical protein
MERNRQKRVRRQRKEYSLVVILLCTVGTFFVSHLPRYATPRHAMAWHGVAMRDFVKYFSSCQLGVISPRVFTHGTTELVPPSREGQTIAMLFVANT